MDENLKDLKKGDYILYARATGDISGGTNDGVTTCASDSNTGKLIIDRNFVILSDLQVLQLFSVGLTYSFQELHGILVQVIRRVFMLKFIIKI